MNELHQELVSLPILQGIEPDDLDWLTNQGSITTMPKGTMILSPDHSNDKVYIVLSGRLKVIFAADVNVETVVEAGTSVGEMSIIEDTFPSATVITDTDARLLVISGETLWSLIDRSHQVARNLLHEFSARIRHNDRMIVESTRQQNVYADQALTDSLTNLRNRYWLDDKLHRLLERCAHERQPVSLMMLDIDHFKIYNDAHGHLAGDRALQTVANSVRDNLRPIDIAARYGGEEFVAFLPDIERDDARLIGERLCSAIRSQKITDERGGSLPSVTVSIGIASTQDGSPDRQLLAAADAAMYRAKKAGRDRVSL